MHNWESYTFQKVQKFIIIRHEIVSDEKKLIEDNFTLRKNHN